jgi:hypothetical protein
MGKLMVGLTRILLLCAVLLVIPGLGEAGLGEVCYSSPLPVTQANPLMNETTFACASIGVVTIPQIYQLGGRVAHLSHQALVDVNDPLGGQAVWMILIEKL